MRRFIREYAFFADKSKLETFRWKTGNILHFKDLAQALGVSIPTVSRALKDSPEISRELCAKAKKLAKEMNYRPILSL